MRSWYNRLSSVVSSAPPLGMHQASHRHFLGHFPSGQQSSGRDSWLSSCLSSVSHCPASPFGKPQAFLPLMKSQGIRVGGWAKELAGSSLSISLTGGRTLPANPDPQTSTSFSSPYMSQRFWVQEASLLLLLLSKSIILTLGG